MNLPQIFKKYRYVLLVVAAGIALMLVPSEKEPAPAPSAQSEAADLEARLEQILSRIDGAGEVAVMLTEASGEEVCYQTDGEDTVLVTGSDRSEQGLERIRRMPVYRGAIVVCAGADSAAVRLAVVEAVANVTGLGSDKITVLKMEQEVFA